VKFKVDHNLPVELAALLRESGHEAATAAEQGLADAGDDVLAAHCLAEARCLVTLDMGFSNIRLYPPQQYFGIIVLRARRHDKLSVLAMGRSIVNLMNSESVLNRLWIVEPDRIRVHSGEISQT
jgi:predicted nuclease of predicted toxin-antitoxin system